MNIYLLTDQGTLARLCQSLKKLGPFWVNLGDHKDIVDVT